jgi:hypothetical protein
VVHNSITINTQRGVRIFTLQVKTTAIQPSWVNKNNF